MKRRTFISGIAVGLIAAPLAAEAQQPGKVYRIGMLETISTALNAANLDAFRQGLRELGYVEGQNVVIEYRSADGRQGRSSAMRSSSRPARVEASASSTGPTTASRASSTT